MRAGRLCLAVLAILCLFVVTASPAGAATILVYHSFGTASSMSISLAAFEAQLDYLQHSGYVVIPLDELTHCIDAHRNPPDRAVVIAIDDGWRTVMRAYEVLKRRNLPFTLFLPMAYVANPACTATLSKADIEELKTYPKVTFADHSFSHSPRLARDGDFAREDVRKDRQRFKTLFGFETPYFAYPYGAHSEAYRQLLHDAGFKYLFVTGAAPVSFATPETAIPRVAAHRMSLPYLASVLREHEAVMARMTPPATPEASGTLLSATRPAEGIPRNVE